MKFNFYQMCKEKVRNPTYWRTRSLLPCFKSNNTAESAISQLVQCKIHDIHRQQNHSIQKGKSSVTICTKYIPSSDQAHIGTYLWTFWTCKYKKVHTQLAQCCNGMYSGILQNCLTLLCSCTHLLVMLFMLLGISTFWFGTWNIQICTAQICTAQMAVQIWMYLVPNWNGVILRIVNSITRRYVQLQSSTRQFLSTYHCSMVPYQVCTEFVLQSRQHCRTATSLQRCCLGMQQA